MSGTRIVDENLDLVVYACDSCGREMGSPMPSRMRCLECGSPMSPRWARGGADEGWKEWHFSEPVAPLQPELMQERGEGSWTT